MFRISLRHCCAMVSLLMLAACGNVAEPVGRTPSQSPGSPVPRSAVVTAAPAVQPTVLSSADPTAASPGVAGDLPESTTTEGYHILGRADAPVTLTMYSDFL